MFKLTLAFLFIACFVAAEAARVPAPYYRDPIERFYKVFISSCYNITSVQHITKDQGRPLPLGTSYFIGSEHNT